ncbi:MAG: inositol 2-dehydrogenase [Rhodospirillales bacterium]|nr:inositol 2-dehydrogenase [Rhodospirillales bacterium]
MVRIGLLGCGRIGRLHALNIARHAGAELARVFDVHQPAADELAASHACPVARSVAEILDDKAIDAVLIATSTDTHADLIEAAAKAGKAILCEKPIDLSLARVRQCAATIAPYKVPVQIGFNRRFDASHRAAREAMIRGEIGDLHQVIITSRDPEMAPKSYLASSGGMLRDMTIHDFDLARFMLGEEPTEVFAQASALVNPAVCAEVGDIDSVMILMKTGSGKLCHINNSRQAVYGYDQRVELFGSAGMLISDNQRPYDLKHFDADQAGRSEPYQFFFLERYARAFVAELDSFVQAVAGKTRPEVGFEDGEKALALAEAAYESLATGKAVAVG